MIPLPEESDPKREKASAPLLSGNIFGYYKIHFLSPFMFFRNVLPGLGAVLWYIAFTTQGSPREQDLH